MTYCGCTVTDACVFCVEMGAPIPRGVNPPFDLNKYLNEKVIEERRKPFERNATPKENTLQEIEERRKPFERYATSKENILQEANRITSVDRRKEYGSALESFTVIARLWSVVLGYEVTPLQVSLCMIQLKVAREMNGHKRDSLVDIAGYARTAEMIMDGE